MAKKPTYEELEQRVKELEKEAFARKQAEEKREHLKSVLEAIRNVNQLITTEKDRGKLIKGVCENLTETRGYYNAWIALTDESGGLAAAAESGLGEDFIPIVKRLKRADLPSCGRRALSHSDVAVTVDPHSTCTDCTMAVKYAGRGGLTVRLEYNGKVYGLLFASIPGKFILEIEEHALFKEVAGDVAFALSSIELTEKHKRAEAALQESEQRLSSIVNNTTAAIYLKDAQGCYLLINKHAAGLVNKSEEDFLGRTDDEIFPPEFASQFKANDGRVIESGVPFETEEQVMIDDGMLTYLTFKFPVCDSNGVPVAVGGISTDITDRKLAEEALKKLTRDLEQEVKKRTAELVKANEQLKSEINERKKMDESLRESELWLDSIFNSLEEAVIVLTPDRQMVNVNNAVESMFGYFREELRNRSVEFLHVDHEHYLEAGKQIKAAFDKGEAAIFEFELKRKNGEIFPTEHIISLLRNQQGESLGIVSVVHDNTKRKLAEKEKYLLEEQLRQAQKMEAVGTLAGGVAHDFNNLVQVISIFTEILLMKKDRSDPDYNQLKEIDQTAQRAGELIEQLLIFSRRVESKLRPVILNREVEQVSKLLERTIPKMISLEFRPAENLNVINADPVQIEQILMNLGVNARDAMPEGGRLLFETENVTLDEQYCQTHPGAVPGEYVLLSVTDTGCGMDQDILEHIFEPFYTTSKTGKETGLGLAVVYGIVKSHSGYITCDSEPGQGATFKIYFPVLMTESPVPKRTEPKKVELPGGKETILVVDDTDSLLRANKMVLESYGYKTIMAESGEKAIEIFEREKENIDLVILDVGMPGIGGIKCLEQLFELEPKVKVIFATGYEPKGKIKEALESGAAGYMGKPYRLADILGKVREVVDKK